MEKYHWGKQAIQGQERQLKPKVTKHHEVCVEIMEFVLTLMEFIFDFK